MGELTKHIWRLATKNHIHHSTNEETLFKPQHSTQNVAEMEKPERVARVWSSSCYYKKALQIKSYPNLRNYSYGKKVFLFSLFNMELF